MLRHAGLLPVLLLAFLPSNSIAAEEPKQSGNVAGILITSNKDSITVKADGETEPVKYTIDTSDKKLVDSMKMIFNACRVQLSYKLEGESRRLVSCKRQIAKATGSITGSVVKVYDNFWVEVKPKVGVSDAFAPGANYNDPKFMELLRSLQEGDVVTITYTTDFERHRIQSMKKHEDAGRGTTGQSKTIKN